jgi:SAM-dependent methyltransferase
MVWPETVRIGSASGEGTKAADLRPCPVCGSEDSSVIRDLELVVPEKFSLQHTFSINRCVQCGAVFHDVNPQPSRDDYYESYTGSETAGYQVSEDQTRFNELTLGFLERTSLKMKESAIADIGCSYGITLMSLRERGFDNLYAIDPDRAAIKYLSDQAIPGRAGSILDPFPELEKRFDLVILRHVLEHLDAPRNAILNVEKWLKPGGRIYIELPDLTRYQACGPFPGYYFEYEHINHFSLFSLLNLMRAYTLIQYESTSEIYPCQRAIFEKSEIEKPLNFSGGDAPSALCALTRPSTQGAAVLGNIAALGTREIALWGVSTFVYRLLTHTPLRTCNIKHLVDRNPKRQGERLLGLTVEAPESLRAFRGDIVICGENSADSIEQSIRSLGFDNPIARLMRIRDGHP